MTAIDLRQRRVAVHTRGHDGTTGSVSSHHLITKEGIPFDPQRRSFVKECTSASICFPRGTQRTVAPEPTAVDLGHTPGRIHSPGSRRDRSTERFFIGTASAGGVVIEHAFDHIELAASEISNRAAVIRAARGHLITDERTVIDHGNRVGDVANRAAKRVSSPATGHIIDEQAAARHQRGKAAVNDRTATHNVRSFDVNRPVVTHRDAHQS